MRYIYLIRHGELALPDQKKRCYGRTEIPLSPRGIEQGRKLGEWAASRGIETVYTSPAERCRETAALLADGGIPVKTIDAMHEVNVGEWEGLTFDEIRERWPKIYAARGNKMNETPPPGGESFRQAAARFDEALKTVLNDPASRIAVVAHSGVIRGWLSRYGLVGGDDVFSIPVPYAGIATLQYDGKTLMKAIAGTRATLVPEGKEIEEYYSRCNTPEIVIAHCRAVAEKAEELTRRSGVRCNTELLRAACLLHDMRRTDGREHPQLAAHMLRMDGYPTLACVVVQHHDLSLLTSTEAELLYLSDKLVTGTETVALEKRFSDSRQKCVDDDAKRNWEQRLGTARNIVNKYQLEDIV